MDGCALDGVSLIGGPGGVGCAGLQVCTGRGVGFGVLCMIGGCTRFRRFSGMVCGGFLRCMGSYFRRNLRLRRMTRPEPSTPMTY